MSRGKNKKKKRPTPAVIVRGFYLVSVGAIFFGLAILLGLLTGQPAWLHPVFLVGLAGLAGLFALEMAAFHVRDARRNGAAFLTKRLPVKPLDLRKDHHRRMEALCGKLRPASGNFRVRPYVVPSQAVDALALVLPDGTAGIAMTEALLLELSAEEIAAVAAFELTLIERGEAEARGFVCGLGDFFERVAATMIPERLEKPGFEERLSSLLRSILGRSLEPEADFEADAAAAGMVRDPLALARALKKAEARAASGERLSPAYGPMLLVGPGSKNEGFRRAAGWKVPRPSPKARIRRLADLAGADPNRIL